MLYVFLPMYNEEKAIAKVVAKLEQASSLMNVPMHILVVDDGSTDRSVEQLDGYRNKPRFTLVRHDTNRGIDQVFRTGITFLTTHATPEDSVVLMEADDTNDLASLPLMLRSLEQGNDIVIASRFVPGGHFIGFPFWRSIPCKIVNRMLKYIFAVENVTDYTIFFRAYSLRLLQQGIAHYGDRFIETVGFVANAEILLKLSTLHPRICEVPLIYRYNLKESKSKLKILFTIRQYLKLISDKKIKQRGRTAR